MSLGASRVAAPLLSPAAPHRWRPVIAAVVLAAGRSTRMRAGHKLLQPFGASTVLGMSVSRIEASAADSVLVVLGHDAGRVRGALPAGGRAGVVVAHNFAQGLAASLAAGLAACPPATGGVLVCLGDMPLVRPDTIDAVIARFRAARDPAAIAAPVHGGRRGHPVLWGAAHLPALAALRGDAGGRAILASHPVLPAAVDDPGTLLDVDTDAALAAARDMWRAGAGG